MNLRRGGAFAVGDDVDRAQLERVDRELFRLARGQGRARLQMGEGLAELVRHGWHRELGFSSVAAYSYERLSLAGRTVSQMQVVARRLAELPATRRALEAGRIGWSTAEVLARHATPETEAELLELASGISVRALRAALKERRGEAASGSASESGSRSESEPDSASESGSLTTCEPDPRRRVEPEDDEPLCTLTLTMPVEDAAALEATSVLIDHMSGTGTGPGAADRWLELLVAEGQCTLVNRAPSGVDVVCEDLVDDLELMNAEREASMERRARAEARAEGRVVARQEVEAGEVPEVEPLPGDAVGMDRYLRQRSMELAGRELWLGKMLVRFFAADGWRRLGYATDTQYARERLGMSRAAMYRMMRLARRTRGFDRIGDAVANGHIGTEAALLLVRVVRPDTEEAWLDRARVRTYKHLRDEVEWVELALRLGAEGLDPGPPTPATIAQYQALMRDIMTGKLLRRMLGGRSGEVEGGAEHDAVRGVDGDLGAEPEEDAVQTSAATGKDGCGPGTMRVARARTSLGKVTVRLRVRQETALFFRRTEQAYLEAGGEPGRFVRFLCLSFWETWVDHLGQSDRWEHVYARELYRCSSPVCLRKECTAHHIRFRSHGGGDEDENMAAPCWACHGEGIHRGTIRLFGPASRMRWLFGRKPILEVAGRGKRLLA